MHLYEIIQQKVAAWRDGGYVHAMYPAIAEILHYAALPEGNGLRYLRPPQLRALETYWYLRLVERTPRIPDLYARYFPRAADRLAALGLGHTDLRDIALNEGSVDGLLARVRTDDALVKQYQLEAARETLTLDYPSYIFALAMGAGKTALIGAIIATEFAMAVEYPDGLFVQNALVFAPGRTILEALRELADVPYDLILPPRLYRRFVARYKLIFTRDGDKGIPVIPGDVFNIVVTNTEKIRIQRRTARARASYSQLKLAELEQHEQEEVNLRLQTIASLPNLAVFSDEAHHTYGQALEQDLKRVRQTVDYLHASTNLICVVNTTGTPYYKRQLLRDVVVWYGLSQGIRDNILKDVSDNIYAYRKGDTNAEAFIDEVVRDFFTAYGKVALPNGATAKLALYFPQEEDLQALRPVVEQVLAELGLPPSLVLRNTSQSTQEEIDAFNRLNDPNAPHRVILLVNKGTEGWNCPSLFATALARKLRSSNNFVLQAATRCLRQVKGNPYKARIYLSMDNYGTLDSQLQETYGERLSDLERSRAETRPLKLVVRHELDVPRLVVRRQVRTVVARQAVQATMLHLALPAIEGGEGLILDRATLAEHPAGYGVLQFVDEQVVGAADVGVDLYTAATRLAAVYRLDAWGVYRELRRIYSGADDMPGNHLPELARQIEAQTRVYDVQTDTIEEALALVKIDGFERELSADGQVVYTTTIQYPISREELLAHYHEFKAGGARERSFHYTPYAFDSAAEQNFFSRLMVTLDVDPDDVQDVFFTGGLTNEKQSDFYVEYKGADGRWHRYVPDFLIRKKDGRCLIVEIKDARWEHDVTTDLTRAGQGQEGVSVEGRKVIALQRWTSLDPDRLAYQVIFAQDEHIAVDDENRTRQFHYDQRGQGDRHATSEQ